MCDLYVALVGSYFMIFSFDIYGSFAQLFYSTSPDLFGLLLCVCVCDSIYEISKPLSPRHPESVYLFIFFITHCIWVIVFVFQGLCSPAPSLDKPTPYSLINLRLTDIDVT